MLLFKNLFKESRIGSQLMVLEMAISAHNNCYRFSLVYEQVEKKKTVQPKNLSLRIRLNKLR